jgi:hypothetical protein
MKEMALPTNIKQIGSIGDGLRIYMEDYVCTYLFQYAESAGYDERLALLVGRRLTIDGQEVLFINGAVQGKHTEERDGLLRFTEKTGAHANAMIQEFFEGMEIVGWMQSQPSYGTYLNQQYAAYHIREFPREYQVMFVTDPIERVNTFYAVNQENNALEEIRGYFIYYDKNAGMHEYMLRNKATEYTAQPPSFVELTRMERAEDPPETSAVRRPSGPPEEIIRRHQSERRKTKSVLEQRRTTNLLVSLSAVLFIICFVMGAGLIQNQDSIVNMETQITQLNTAYRNLLMQINGSAAPVFAAQTDEDTVPPTAAPTLPPAQVYEENGTLPSDDDMDDPEAAGPETSGTTPAETETTDIPADNITQTDAETPSDPTRPEAYTIQPGDSLLAISARFYGNTQMVDDILALNGIENADHIVAGKTIALP